MKRRYLVLCVMLVIVLLASTIEASAMNTGFLTEDMSEEDRNGAQENNMGKVDMLSSEPKFLLGFFSLNLFQKLVYLLVYTFHLYFQ